MRLFKIFAFLLFANTVFAQVDPEYLLVLKKATTAEMNAVSPDKGSLIYNTDDDQIYKFNGTTWVSASADADTDSSNELQALSYDPATHIATLTSGGTIDLSSLIKDDDWTISGNDQYSGVTGNVGIGNSAPSSRLDVTGSTHISETLNLGPNASGSRLSIYDDGHSGSMLDIQTDDEGPWAFRILNKSYKPDLANSFRLYQENKGAINMSVGGLSKRFLSIGPESSNGLGSISIGSPGGVYDRSLLYVNRGSVDVGPGHYFSQKNSMIRLGNIVHPTTTIGIDNYLGCKTIGDSSTYIGTRNYTFVGSGNYTFSSVTAGYDFAYNKSKVNNAKSSIFGSRGYAYDYSDGGLSAVYGGLFHARKNQGSGEVRALLGASISTSRRVDVGKVLNAYGISVNASGGSNVVVGEYISAHSYSSPVASLFGSNIRLYADSSFKVRTGYGININSSKTKEEITNNLYNININSSGYTSLINNFGVKIHLKDGKNNYGLFVDVQNGANRNYSIYANSGKAYFKDALGLGVKYPDEALHVGGNMRLNGTFEDKDGQAGTAGQVLSTTGTGTDWVDISSLAQNGWSIVGNDMHSDVTGNIGINNTSPRSKLDVDGILIEGDNASMFGTQSSTGSCVISHGIASFFTNVDDNNYIHIRLPYVVQGGSHMYHVRARGYRYRSGKTIDITWVGYAYNGSSTILETNIVNAGSPEFNTTQYVGSDKHVYLRFKGTTGSNYFQSFRIDSMHVGNGTVLKKGDVQIISSASATL